jgi:putative hemolysin
VLRVLIGGLAAGLALVAVRALRRPAVSAGRVAPAGPDADLLLERIAQLDARYAGREAATDPAEWNRYRAERAELKARLEAVLAARSERT